MKFRLSKHLRGLSVSSAFAVFTAVTAITAATSLAGCGGGGGGATAPTERTGIASAYYPVDVGATWAYAVTTSSTPEPFLDEMVVTGQGLYAGVNAWVIRESNPAGDQVPVDSYYAKDTRAFTYLGDSDASNWVTSVIRSFDLMRFDGTFSAAPLLSRNDFDIGVDLDGDGQHERVDAQLNGTVEGFETMVTALGRFSNTARLRYDITGTVKLSRGGVLPVTQTLREWRAPAVGALRQSLQMTIAGITESDEVTLRGLSVHGVVAGVLPPKVLLDALASADSDTTQPGQPALATDGTRYLLVSQRQTGAGRQWLGRFVGTDGQLQDTFDISAVADVSGPPRLAWNGSHYLLLTRTNNPGSLRAQRISAAGAVLDTWPGIDTAPDGYAPALAAGAGGWLVVYGRTSVPGSLYGRFISAAGLPRVEFAIATGVTGQAAPAVAFDGSNFVVVWESGGANPAATDLYAMRVSPQGALQDAAPWAISTAAEAQLWPRIACDSTNCLVTWVDRRHYPGQSYSFSPGPGDLYGAFVTRAGGLLNGPAASGGIAIATGITANAGYPDLVFTGSDYLAAWSRGAFANNPGGPTGIYAARISTDGAVSPTGPGMVLSWPPPSATRYVYPTLAATPSGVLATWLSNTELAAGSKHIDGTVVWPTVSR